MDDWNDTSFSANSEDLFGIDLSIFEQCRFDFSEWDCFFRAVFITTYFNIGQIKLAKNSTVKMWKNLYTLLSDI